ncbi:MAG: restriction endonuclease [Candidatus Ornithomonoglobus sp.]
MTVLEISSGISGILLAFSIFYSLIKNRQEENNEEIKEDNADHKDEEVKEDTIGRLNSEQELHQIAPKNIRWLSDYEYSLLSSTEKTQLELDRYRCRQNKTNYEVGLEYERYIGYLCEKQSYEVEYYGAVYGIRDKGIDLIAMKDENVYIIQCKRWSIKNIVHENSVFQLAGTIKYLQEKKPNKHIQGIIVTSTVMSQDARDAASELKIKIYENVKMDNRYPCIKCSIDELTGQRIYHMPNDPNYDNCKIKNSGEFYAYTIEEAESKGFVRAINYKRMK